MSKWKFFKAINPDMVKKQFRDLAMKYHPDRAGDGSTRIMQEIIAEYHAILKSFSGSKFHSATNKEYEYNYSQSYEQRLVDKLSDILGLKLANIVVEVVGSWIWVGGTSKEQADLFNRHGVGMKWSKKQGRWYWSPTKYKRRSSGLSYDQIKSVYGSTTVHNDEATQQVG